MITKELIDDIIQYLDDSTKVGMKIPSLSAVKDVFEAKGYEREDTEMVLYALNEFSDIALRAIEGRK